MEKRLLDGVYLYDGIHPDPRQIIENFKSANDIEKKKFYKEIQDSGLVRNPSIEKVIRDYEYERALSS